MNFVSSDRGQCGIPELDDLEKMHISKNNEELTKPIDFDLNEDFDFEKNLEIFRNYVSRFGVHFKIPIFPLGIISSVQNSCSFCLSQCQDSLRRNVLQLRLLVE